MSGTNWITDRQPTEADGDSDGDVSIQPRPDSTNAVYIHWGYVGSGAPWKRTDYWQPPASEPEPEPQSQAQATPFVWPEPTDEQLVNYCNKSDSFLDALRAAIHLARRLDAGINPNALRLAWMNDRESAYDPLTWILIRGGTVEPLPPPVPTLAEALAAAQLLGGDAAEVVTRYLQAQQQEEDQG